ncbi:hypothetical protein [Streptomyces pseudovenezuelae]|uniref:hypothetical protein n=1 Tax=Streptomyces pseudovenezuelae TaxID=67350 RepID=UPI0036EDF4F5
MTTRNPSLEEALKAAQSLMNDRLTAVEEHKRSVDAEQEAREALAEAERDSARTWAALLAAGWTPAELKKIGFAEPRVKAPGRPRTARSRSGKDADGAKQSTELPTQTAPDFSTPSEHASASV